MGKCFLCKEETDQFASVYIGRYQTDNTEHSSKIIYEKASHPLCTDCIKKHLASDFSGAWFLIGLQLLWFKVADQGIFSILGGFCALISVVALWRLAVLLIRRWYQQYRIGKPIPRLFYRREDYSEQASSMLKSAVRDYYTVQGMRVLTETEYRRTHKA